MSSRTTSTERQYLEDYADLIQRLLPSVASIAFLDRCSRMLSNRGDDLTPDVLSGVSGGAGTGSALGKPGRATRSSQPTAARRIATLTSGGGRRCSCGCVRPRDSRNPGGRSELTIGGAAGTPGARIGVRRRTRTFATWVAGSARPALRLESASELKWLLEVGVGGCIRGGPS